MREPYSGNLTATNYTAGAGRQIDRFHPFTAGTPHGTSTLIAALGPHGPGGAESSNDAIPAPLKEELGVGDVLLRGNEALRWRYKCLLLGGLPRTLFGF